MKLENQRRWFTGDAGMLALLGLAVVVLFWPAVLMRSTFFVQDMMVQNYPFRHLCSVALKAGKLPLWRPEINCGFPLLAEGQVGFFYPLNLLTYWLLPTYAGLNLNILFHCWLAGAATYVFLRTLECGRGASLSGGLAFACSGFLVVRAMSPNFVDVCAWLPALFVGIELTMQRRRLVFALGTGAIGALQLLAGHPQAAAYGLLAGLAYVVWRSLAVRASWRWTVALLLGVPAAAGLLAAVQLVPTAELARESARAGGLGWDRFVSMSLPPERLLTLLLPDAFGNSADGTYWGTDAGFFIQLCAYCGILPLLLALFAVRHSKVAAVEFFAVLAGAGLVLALGRYTAIFGVLYELPGMASFRIPARFLLWLAFAISVLCGLGLQALAAREIQPCRRGWWWVVAGFIGVTAIMAWLNRELLVHAVSPSVSATTSLAQDYAVQLAWDLVRAVLLLITGGWILTRKWQDPRLLLMGVPLLITVDLFSFGYGFNALIDVEVYQRVPGTAKAIYRHAGVKALPAPRILSVVTEGNTELDWHSGWRRDKSSYRAYPSTLRMYTGSLYGLHNALPGWSPLHLRRHWEFTRGYMGFARLAGVEYVIRPDECRTAGSTQIGGTWPRVCYQPGSLPRAYLVGEYELMPETGARLRYMTDPLFAPRRQVVLEQEPAGTVGSGAGEVTISRHTSHTVDLELRECRGGLVVLSDTYYPGWEARVDGAPAEILRANHVFRAVRVPPGARHVRFSFHPASFLMGAWLSGAAWSCWLLVLAVAWRQPRTHSFSPPRRLGLGSGALQLALILLVHGVATRWPLWSECLDRCRALNFWGG